MAVPHQNCGSVISSLSQKSREEGQGRGPPPALRREAQRQRLHTSPLSPHSSHLSPVYISLIYLKCCKQRKELQHDNIHSIGSCKMQHFVKQALPFRSSFQEMGSPQVQQVVTLQPVRPRGEVTTPQRGGLQSTPATEILAGKPLCTPSVNTTTWGKTVRELQPFQAVGKQRDRACTPHEKS